MGIEAFQDLLDRIDAGESCDARDLLEDSHLTEKVGESPSVEVRSFENRRRAAEYLYELLEAADPSGAGQLTTDKGLWAWLSAAWMDVLAPADRAGRRALKDRPRWVPVIDDFKKYYRHLLAGPYWIYKAHREDPDAAMCVLATPVNKPGELVEQLASRRELITNVRLMKAATRLYIVPGGPDGGDLADGRVKRGAAGKGGGSVRRFVDVLQQFDLTWDFYAMDPDEILGMLPEEFAPFLG